MIKESHMVLGLFGFFKNKKIRFKQTPFTKQKNISNYVKKVSEKISSNL